MDYKFSNLLGVPYRGGNLLFSGDKLLGPAGNRVRELGLGDASSMTFPFQSPHQIQVVVLSPDETMLLTIDTSGRLLLALRHTRVLLHRMRLKAPSQAAKFSPDGSLIAIAAGKVLQVRPCSLQSEPMPTHKPMLPVAQQCNPHVPVLSTPTVDSLLVSLSLIEQRSLLGARPGSLCLGI